jgi:2-methylcitrate dehydratase PrpD
MEVNMNNATQELISNVLETKFDTFSDELVEDAKKRFIDVIGCAIGGVNASGNKMIIDLVTDWGGKKEATILVHGNRLPAHNAAMVNCVMCRSYDYEACLNAEGEASGRMTGHICGTTEPTTLAVAEQKGSTGKDMITASILGADLACRLTTTEDFSWDDSFELTGTANAFGAAAIAGRLWNLNESRMLNAFGILLNQISGSFQSIYEGVHTFKLMQGLSARNGIMSVELADKGFTGIKDPLMGKHGYFDQYCKSYRPEFLTLGLGRIFHTKGAHKLYPCCYGIHASIECGLELCRRYDINADDISDIIVSVPPLLSDSFLNQSFNMGDTQMKASFNFPYNMAIVLLEKGVRLEHFTDKFLQDSKVVDTASKVKIIKSPPPENEEWGQKAWATILKVKTTDGQEFTAQRDAPKGRTDNPLTRDEVNEKFMANVAFSKTVSREKAQKALNLLENLEEIDDVTKIVKLLVA